MLNTTVSFGAADNKRRSAERELFHDTTRHSQRRVLRECPVCRMPAERKSRMYP